jgi:hypothetical protein
MDEDWIEKTVSLGVVWMMSGSKERNEEQGWA